MNQHSPSSERQRLETAMRRFDEENGRDPNREMESGTSQPRELVYARRLTEWVLRLKPDASEPLLLAARSAHLCRWVIPRQTYPMNRSGYLRWRGDLKKFHARKSAEILRECGYPEEVVARVQALVSKDAYPADPESRTLEDALCLIFLEHQLGDLAKKSTDDKVINALQKSWKKMTPLAREQALRLSYSPREKELLDRALRSI